jgi:hypothetical protein
MVCHGRHSRMLAFSALVVLWVIRTVQAQTLSIEDATARLRNQTITGATIITHGYQISNTGGDALRSLADAIHQRTGGWLVDYDIPGDGELAVIDLNQSVLPGAGQMGQNGHVVILYDWAPESNELSRGWTSAAGDALFALTVEGGLTQPRMGAGVPMQFIAHSFGSAVTSEAVRRLAFYGVPVDQVTYLDPHDFDQTGVPVDEAQRQFEVGRPPGYGATIWNNVAFADVYYQTRGHNGGSLPDSIVPNGRPIAGAFNDHQSATADLPPRDQYGAFDGGGDHSYVWDAYYQGTVEGALPAGKLAPQGAVDYQNTGWGLSQFSGRNVPRPAAAFYGPAQDHTFSEPTQVDRQTGDPNNAGLAMLGVTAPQVTSARWTPQFDPLLTANGDFAVGPSVGVLVDITPGWAHHGGGGDGDVEANAEGTNHYLELNSGDAERTHNRLYLPWFATDLLFSMWIADESDNDLLRVRIGDTVLNDYNLATVESFFTTRTLPIPMNLRDTVDTITFEIIAGGVPIALVDSEVRIDDVRFIPEPSSWILIALGGGILLAMRLRRRRWPAIVSQPERHCAC